MFVALYSLANPQSLAVLSWKYECHHGLDLGLDTARPTPTLAPPPAPASSHKAEKKPSQPQRERKCCPRSLIPETFLLVEQIRPRTSQIDNLGTPVAVLLQARALEAIKGITDPLATADNTFVLVIAEGALVTDAD